MWRTVTVAVVAVVLTAATAAQSKFTLKVHTGKGQVGYDVNSTMIIGERDILLIDPQFSLSEAHKLVAEILETNGLEGGSINMKSDVQRLAAVILWPLRARLTRPVRRLS